MGGRSGKLLKNMKSLEQMVEDHSRAIEQRLGERMDRHFNRIFNELRRGPGLRYHEGRGDVGTADITTPRALPAMSMPPPVDGGGCCRTAAALACLSTATPELV